MDILTEIDPQLHFIGLGYDERSKTLKYPILGILVHGFRMHHCARSHLFPIAFE